MDQGWCAGTLAFQITEGNSNGVDLGGSIVILGLYAPGPTLLDGDLTSRLYIDANSSPEQQRELESIFSGSRGGPPEIFAGLSTTTLPTEIVGMDAYDDGGSLTINVGDYGVIESHPLNDESGRPVTIQNAMGPQELKVSDPQVAPAGFKWSDPEMPLEFDTISGVRATFGWSGE